MRIALLIIIFFQVLFGVLYALRTPRWEVPDEPAHFNYVRYLAENGAIPTLTAGDYDQAYLEKLKGEKFPPEDSIDSLRYESHQPPLYYLIAAPIYLAARGLGMDTVLVLRLVSVALAVAVTLLAYRIFTFLFPDNALLAVAGAGLVATVPMHLAMTAAINNDTLAEIIVALILLISIARVGGKLDNRRFIVIGGVVYGIALLTKTTIYASGLLLVAAELGRWAIERWMPNTMEREETEKQSATSGWGSSLMETVLRFARVLAPLFGIGLVISGAWFIHNAAVYGVNDLFGWARHDAVVVGQPTTADWVARYGFKNIFADFFIITFKSFWAQFGWMGVLVSDRIYVFLFVLTGIALLGAVLWGVRMWRTRAGIASTVAWSWILAGILLLSVLAAHVWYNLKFVQPQGRYLFPALIPIAAILVAGLNEVMNARYARLLFVLLYLVLLVLDYVSLFWFILPQLTG